MGLRLSSENMRILTTSTKNLGLRAVEYQCRFQESTCVLRDWTIDNPAVVFNQISTFHPTLVSCCGSGGVTNGQISLSQFQIDVFSVCATTAHGANPKRSFIG